MTTKHINELRMVDDLEDGHEALPDSHMTFVVYPLYAGGTELPVAKVVRRGEHLFAISNAGVERCIAGDGAQFAIRGRYVTPAKRRPRR
jgi:hypothetical protein